MRIVIYSPVFHPLIGGLENVAALIAGGLYQLGHEVCVICQVANGGEAEPFDFRVVRRPSAMDLIRWIRWADAVIQMQISLKGLWPLLLWRRPWLISHQTWLSEWNRPPTWQSKLKRFLCRFATNIACSHAVAEALKIPCHVIQNPYDDQTFHLMPRVSRDRDFLFVGRLVSDKGADLLVEAVGRLAIEGLRPTLTITGLGPEEGALRQQVRSCDIEKQTVFTGALRGEALAAEMNRHRFLVVPSLWPEPYGIVALEGIACGCFVIGSEQGGLKEAIGPCGMVCKNGDILELTAAIGRALRDPSVCKISPTTRQAHLERRRNVSVISMYESFFVG